ncbi:MAG: hypothetical protein COA91_06635 [Robiginitomaculum sp.]|nr:MAG: hypothetical protein COA91_06635 [Robiginitomaculum sp.]
MKSIELYVRFWGDANTSNPVHTGESRGVGEGGMFCPQRQVAMAFLLWGQEGALGIYRNIQSIILQTQFLHLYIRG